MQSAVNLGHEVRDSGPNSSMGQSAGILELEASTTCSPSAFGRKRRQVPVPEHGLRIETFVAFI